MTATTVRKDFGHLPACIKLAQIAGVDPDEEVMVYTEASIAGSLVTLAADLDHTGLVWWQWEEMDEMRRDGKVLWQSTSSRFYSSVFVLAPAHRDTDIERVVHMAMSNSCEDLGLYNVDVEPPCKQCPDHGIEIAGEDLSRWEWCQ